MCTVSYIPGSHQIILTSNRDEKSLRARAIPPTQYGKLLYPKDGAKGGTWAIVNENGNACILLNGGFVKHEPQPHHTKSRGLVLLEIMDGLAPLTAFNDADLTNTEPFTLVLLQQNILVECRWDGFNKHTKYPDMQQPHIWSSATLYDAVVSEKRRQWFYEWLMENPNPSADEVLRFHLFGGNGDTCNDFRMNRDGKMLTVSVTQIIHTKEQAVVKYYDLQDESHHTNTISIQTASTPIVHA